MKKLLFTTFVLVLFFSTTTSFAQDVSFQKLNSLSDQELVKYVKSYESRGISLDQIISIAKTRGASQSEIDILVSRIKNAQLNKTTTTNRKTNVTESDLENSFGYQGKVVQRDKLSYDSTIFGSQFFKNPNVSVSPSANFATPPNYQLGPGDEIIIDLWGSASIQYQSAISKEGTIFIESLGPIYLSGMTIEKASSYLKSKLSTIHSGLRKNASNEAKVYLRLGLAKSRSIVVSVVGQASVPGNYTISAFTSPLNALYSAGGPSDIGSYRNIQHIRNNKVIGTIDLYDYLVYGKTSYEPLNDQDVLLIPYISNQVTVKGPFIKTGKFEMRQNESLTNLMDFSGGPKSEAYGNSVSVTRFVDYNKRQLRVEKDNYSTFNLLPGDVIEASNKDTYVKDRVEVIGEVNVAGFFNLQDATTVDELIQRAQGLTPRAVDTVALLFREKNGVLASMKSIRLKEVLNGTSTIALKSGDRLQILSTKDLKPEENISIAGYVKLPKKYTYFSGVTAKELIAIAGGLQYNANTAVKIYRKDLNDPNSEVKTFTDNLNDPLDDVLLLPFDLVVVNKKVDLTIDKVVLTGETKITGSFPLKENYTVQELISDAGGFLDKADKDGIYIMRKYSEELNKEQDLINFSNSLDTITVQQDKIFYLPVDLKDDNLFLTSGDEIVVSKQKTDITIIGAVQKPTIITYKKGLTVNEAIASAGGALSTAKKSKVYVVNKNKSVSSTYGFLFFRNYPKLGPGATIYVPEKAVREKMSTQEVIGITTGIASLALLINTIFTR